MMPEYRTTRLALLLATAAAPALAQQPPASSAPSTREAKVPAIELQAPVRLRAGEAFIDSAKYIAHSAPLMWDIDGDGRAELLVGNFRGNIQVFKNTGTKEEPVFVDKGLLEAEGKTIKIHNW